MADNIEHRVWFITGASSGLGRALVEIALEGGDKIVAAVRKPESLQDLSDKHRDGSLLVVKVDVSKSSEITSAFEAAQSKFGRIDVVFNNAGFPIVGEVEAFSDADIRSLFETNFFGAMNVATAAVKAMRESKAGGRIFTTTSVSGVHPLPGLAFFGASKAALELALGSLSSELDPSWNIKLTQIVAGSFATNANKSSLVNLPKHDAYSEALGANMVRMHLTHSTFPGSPAKAMQVLFGKISKMDTPPARWVLGQDAAGMVGVIADGLKKDSEASQELSGDVNLDQ